MRKAIANVCRPFTRQWNQWKPGARVLMYHRVTDLGEYDQLTVTPTRFEEQLSTLQRECSVLGLGEALENDKSSVVITFDDGYLDNYLEAAPLLKKYNLPALIYLTSDFADQNASHPRYTSKERLHMNWSEVHALQSDGSISFGSHTCTHPMLSELSDADSKREIVESKQRLEDKLGTAAVSFAYPNGNYGEREVDFVREAGYQHAVTVKPGVNRLGADPLQLRRTEVTDRDAAQEFAAKLDGALDPVHLILDMKREWQFGRRRAHSMENKA